MRRWERRRPGESRRVNIKKLGCFDRRGYRVTGDRIGQSKSRGVDWAYFHVRIGNYSRIAFSKTLLELASRLEVHP